MSNEIKKTEQETVITEAPTPILVLKLSDCKYLRALPGTKPYKNTKTDSRYEGKFFRTFLYNGKGFTVMSEESFCSDVDKKDLFEVRLQPTADGYDYLGHLTKSETKADKLFTVEMDSITVEWVQSKRTIDLEDLA